MTTPLCISPLALSCPYILFLLCIRDTLVKYESDSMQTTRMLIIPLPTRENPHYHPEAAVRCSGGCLPGTELASLMFILIVSHSSDKRVNLTTTSTAACTECLGERAENNNENQSLLKDKKFNKAITQPMATEKLYQPKGNNRGYRKFL